MSGHSHRPHLKQQNKPFKSGHASKGALKQAAKGRLPGSNPSAGGSSKSSSTNHLSTAQTKLNRRNTTKQLQQQKRAALVRDQRLFSGRGGVPRVVCVVELGEGTDGRRCVRELAGVLGEEGEGLEVDGKGVVNVSASRFKTSLQFIIPPARDLYTILDSTKAADYVVFLLSDETDVSEWGDTLLRCLQGQGIGEAVAIVQSPEPTTPPTPPPQATLKSLLSFIRYFFPTTNKVYNTSLPSDASVTLRALCEGVPKDVSWRENRAYIVNEGPLEFEDGTEEGGEGKGTLVVSGFVRGGKLSADRLVHIQNYGDFQIDKIIHNPLPSSHNRAPAANAMSTDPLHPSILSSFNPETSDSLVDLNDPDFMANEQTWPTEEEMNSAPAAASSTSDGLMGPPALPSSKTTKRVPKGTSAYQAEWMIEEDGDDEDGSDEDDDSVMGEGGMEADSGLEAADGVQGLEGLDGRDEGETDAEGTEEIELESRTGKSERFEDMDQEEEDEQLEEYRRSRQSDDRTDLAFPDEVDTPKHIPAAIRFQRYRGLKSFRTSPWDPYENLPVDYAKIFGFEDYDKTGRRVMKEAREQGVDIGTRVRVYIKNVPKAVYSKQNPLIPFFLFGLFEHEHKQSVLNFVVQRNTEYDEPVKSKDPLILCVGPRRYRINPIYSQHVRGGGKGANNVHKSERYLRSGMATVATIYGPIVFGKQPCLLLRETEDVQAPILVASGSFLNADTKRIIAKRIILTGHPFKVHKKTATIRFMFFNRDDVNYFAPVQMHTKYGRTGHISESLGTHGYFKAHFDAPLNQMDTVCMSLYKRSYPKWSEPFVMGAASASLHEMDEDEEMA